MLGEIVAKAAARPDTYPDLKVAYRRGHEMSGVTACELRDGRSYRLKADNQRRQTAYAFSGALSLKQRQGLLEALVAASFFDIPSSTRVLDDDEIPVTIEVAHDDLNYQLDMWAADGRENAAYVQLEQAFRALFAELSDGQIRR